MLYIILMKKVAHINIKHLKSIQYNIGNGITEPKFAFLDDNTQVVAKLFNGPEGNLILFNEYFCYRLAILLNIDMPVSGVFIMDKDTEVFSEIASDINQGYGFYSTHYSKVAPLNSSIISLIKNRFDIIKIILFDHIIFNTDRNPGNLLVQFYKNNISLKVIDHSHVFINQSIWDSRCLIDGMQEKDYLSTKILDYNNYLYSMFFRNMAITKESIKTTADLFRKSLNRDIMNNIISQMPKEWMPSDSNVDTLINYLMYRIDNLDIICSIIYNHIKN